MIPVARAGGLCRFGAVTHRGSSLIYRATLPWLWLGLALAPSLAAGAPAQEAPAPRRWSSPQPTGETLVAIWGSDGGVWVTGDAGTILRSTDHGATWAALDSGTTQNLRAIWGSDEGDLWVTGDGGTVLHSSDEGRSWKRLGTPVSGALLGVWGSGAHDVYLAGPAGQLLHTNDHGRSFTTLRPLGDTDEPLTAVWGSGADDVYVAGDHGSVVSTSDHGARWSAMRKPQARAGKDAGGGGAALSIVGTGRGDLVGVFGSGPQTHKGGASDPSAEHTRDGGKTWTEIRVEPAPAPWPGYHAFQASGEGTDRIVQAVATFESWDRPADERQRLGLIVSRDGGATFERRSLLPHGALVSALWRDPTGPLIAVGPMGTILRSRDDGHTWEEGRGAHPFGAATLRALWTDGSREAWAVGDACTVLHSSDGGARWELQHPCPAGAGTELQAVWSGESDAVYIGGAVVARTVDRGQHWAVVTPPAPVTSSWRVWSGGSGDLYAAGYGVWRSTDEAQTWRLVDGSRSRNRPDWFGHLFGAGNDRYAVTQFGRLERGSKTGAGWQPVAPPASAGAGCCAYWADGTSALYAFGANRAHAFFRSRDGGRSFQPLTTSLSSRTSFIAMHRRGDELFLLAQDPDAPEAPNAPHAANPMEPFTTLLRSNDDGATWTTQADLPWTCTALGTVEGGLLGVGADGLIVRLR